LQALMVEYICSLLSFLRLNSYLTFFTHDACAYENPLSF
jgi:hypothetical protein